MSPLFERRVNAATFARAILVPPKEFRDFLRKEGERVGYGNEWELPLPESRAGRALAAEFLAWRAR